MLGETQTVFQISFDNEEKSVFDLVDVIAEFRPKEWRDAKAVLPETDCLVYIGHEHGECSGRFSAKRKCFEWINPMNSKTTWHPEHGDSTKWVKFPLPVQFWQPYYLNE